MFSERLRMLRKEKQLSGEQLGKVFNVTKTAISYWENGKTFPDEDTLKKMSDFFDVSLDFLLGRTDKRNPEGKEEIETIAAHKDGDEWTEEELEAIENFKKMVRNLRK